jgi:hypothetical protein
LGDATDDVSDPSIEELQDVLSVAMVKSDSECLLSVRGLMVMELNDDIMK